MKGVRNCKGILRKEDEYNAEQTNVLFIFHLQWKRQRTLQGGVTKPLLLTEQRLKKKKKRHVLIKNIEQKSVFNALSTDTKEADMDYSPDM